MDSDDIATTSASRRSATFRALHRKLDPIDGPRNLGAKRLALRDQRHRQDVADWHVGLLKTGSQGTLNRPGFRGGSNSGEWSHEEVPEVFA